MNQIEQLTKNYLDSLYVYGLDESQRQRIIKINSQKGWIIFKGSSLNHKYATGADALYDINSPPLRELFKESLKLHHSSDWKDFLLTDEDPNSISLDDVNIDMIRATRDKKLWIGYGSWVAFDKTVFQRDIGAVTMDIEHADINVGGKLKVGYSLNDLLNDPEIRNSTPPQMEKEPESTTLNTGEDDSNNDKTNPETPPEEPPENFTGDSISFIIDRVEKMGQTVYRLTSQSEFTFLNNGREEKINKVSIHGAVKIKDFYQKGELSVGKSIVFTKISSAELFYVNGDGKLTIIDDSRVDIQVFYAEVKQKNAELAQEEKGFVDLVTELTDIIKKNNQTCQEAQKLGLKLPAISLENLNYFKNNFFQDLDEKLTLTDPANQNIITENEIVRKKKANIQASVYQIYHKNLKKLADYQKRGPSAPDSDLERHKKEAIEIINRILTDKDNLQNIDLSTWEGGKYLNWEEELTACPGKEEVNNYEEKFLAALKKFLAQQKNEEDSSRNRTPHGNSRVDTSPISQATSLAEARKIAKKLIIDLIFRYGTLKEGEEIWAGSRTWIEHLEKLDSREKIKGFVQQFEERSQKATDSLNTQNSSSSLTGLIIASIIVVSLAVIAGVIILNLPVKQRRKRVS